MGKDLSARRLEKAEASLKEAKMLLDSEHLYGATNRSYYCIFHCMRSIQALENIEFKKHSAVIAHFRNNYIKTNLFDKQISKIISNLYELRNKSDYDDFFMLSKKEVTEQIESAEYFFEEVKAYLKRL